MTNVSPHQAAAALPGGGRRDESGAMTQTAAGTTTDTMIELRGLERSFGPIHAVRGVDLTISPGEVVALLGPNGAGKSTTLDMLLGLAEPDRGTVAIAGRPPDEAIRAGAAGAMPQTGGLLRDLTAPEPLPRLTPRDPQ